MSVMPHPRAGRAAAAALGLLLVVSAAAAAVRGWPAAPAQPRLLSAGIVGSHHTLDDVYALPAGWAQGGYVEGSSVLRLTGEAFLAGPADGPGGGMGASGSAALRSHVHRLVRAQRDWLAAGDVPGRSAADRDLAARALLDLHLLTRPNGATVAAWHPHWRYVWPRDASWVAAAFAATGHRADAWAVLRFLARVQRADGTWDARYRMDGSGPVDDGRAWQLDANGWVPWAVWFWWQSQPRPASPAALRQLRELLPMVAAAADAATAALGPEGLPHPAPDYWETRTDEVTLGTAAPLLAGLRAAADLAAQLGWVEAQRRWAAAAIRLDSGVRKAFGPLGYPRFARPWGGADAAVTFLAPPFAAADPAVARAVRDAAERLTLPNGGITPGEWFPGPDGVAWTPETAFFGLAAAASGDSVGARERLDWLAAHRTPLGGLPEKVDAAGRPASVAPLGWTGAAVLLTLVALERGLPVPPQPLPEGAPGGTG